MSAARLASPLLLLGTASTLPAAVWARILQAAATAAAGNSYALAEAEGGMAVYVAHCAACHGIDMQGTRKPAGSGPAAFNQ